MDGPDAAAAAADCWTTLENMALAKSIFKYGETDWNTVSRTLKQNYGQARDSDFFSHKNCAAQYAKLVRQVDEMTSNRPDQADSEKVPDVVRITRLLYFRRIEELKKAIQKDDDTVRNISHELVEIRQGKWDERLDENLVQPNSLNADDMSDTVPGAKSSDDRLLESLDERGIGNMDGGMEEERATDEEKQNIPSRQIASETTENGSQGEISNEADPSGEEKSIREEEEEEVEEPKPDGDIAGEKLGKVDSTTDSSEHTSHDDKLEDGAIEPTTDVSMETAKQVSYSNDAVSTQPHEPSDSDSELAEATVEPPLQPPSPVKRFPPQDNNENDGSTQKEAGLDAELLDDDENKERPLTRLRKRTLSGVLHMLPPSTTTTVEATTKSNQEIGSTKDERVKLGEEDDSQEGHVAPVNHDARESELDDDAILPVRKKVKKAAALRRDSEDADSNISSDVELSDAGSGSHSLRSPSYASSRLTPPGVIIGDAERTKRWRKLILPIWSHIANHRHGPMFMQSIREKEAPGYFSAVKRPMSLSDVKKRVTSGAITTTAEFHRDVLQVFANALMYNKENTDIYGMANELHADAQLTIKQHVQTERAVTRRDSCGPSGRRKSGSVTSVSDEVYTPPVNRGESSAENPEASTPGDISSL